MPAGKTHEKINGVFLHIVVFTALHIICYLHFGWVGVFAAFLFVGGYVFGTYYFGPDLDIKSRPFYRWKFLRFIWKPYQRMFAHRSFWTHGILVGDVVRFCYLLGWLLIPYALFSLFANEQWEICHAYLKEFLFSNPLQAVFFFSGVVAASTLHILADLIGSTYKKRKRKKRSG